MVSRGSLTEKQNSCYRREDRRPVRGRTVPDAALGTLRELPGRRSGGVAHGIHLAELYGVFFNPELLDIVETLCGEAIKMSPVHTVRCKYLGKKRR